jgi:hypothetical protein
MPVPTIITDWVLPIPQGTRRVLSAGRSRRREGADIPVRIPPATAGFNR